MSTAQWFLLGMMAGWTPSLLFLGWCLRVRNILEGESNGSICYGVNEPPGQ